MQSLRESLLNYIMRHHHETFGELRPNHEEPPWAPTKKGSWNYALTMRHHHELSPRGSWNYILTMRHHHESHQEIHWITS